MSLNMTINTSQKQQMVMTSKMVQAIKILQMPRLELAQYISHEMLENPILEEVESEVMDEDETDEDIESKEQEDIDEESELDIDLDSGTLDTDQEASSSLSDDDLPEMDINDEDFGDLDYEKYFDDSPPINKNEWEVPDDDDTRDTLATQDESLEDYLLWQLRMTDISNDDYLIGESIIGNINDDGYLIATPEEIAQDIDKDVSEVEKILQIIKTFDPTGVGANDLKECLMIQLEQLDSEDTVAYEIIKQDHLEDLESNRIPQIAKALGVEIDIVQEAAKLISTLEPKPGRQFSSIKPNYIIPDVVVEKVDGEYKVFMNEGGPRLGISPYYRNMLSSGNSLSPNARKYVMSKFRSAKWLLESIECRRRTILEVTRSIFEVQRDFLEKGEAYIKPLTLKDIADRVDRHEGTISRVTNGRYVQTPRGVYELKYFFGSGLSTKSGGKKSAISVKEMIKEMIENENPKKPLSDKDIEKQLNKKGVEIKRRTVQKYRDELNIPSSTKRKRW
ncbi:RNA polymerase factor sigma-54 [Candidatus Poribacteria bacterium]|nr:RNA polymerase factor sigma-54 [Candidatus Poribacteria bacterium]